MREIGKVIKVKEIEAMDIIRITDTVLADDYLVYKVDEENLCVISNINSEQDREPKFLRKENLVFYDILLVGKMGKLEEYKPVMIEDIESGVKFMFVGDTNITHVYIKTSVSEIRKGKKVFHCVDLNNGDMRYFTEGREIIPRL